MHIVQATIGGSPSKTENLESFTSHFRPREDGSQGVVDEWANDDRKLHIVGGKDERKVFNLKAYPYRTIGRLRNADGSTCTGTMVGPQVMLTAQHCLKYDRDGKLLKLVFTPGLFKGERPWGSYRAINAYYVQRKTDLSYRSASLDFALVVLNKPVGDRVGWMGTKVLPNSWINTELFESAGYPQDYRGRSIIFRNGRVREVTRFEAGSALMIESDVDTINGQSGSPLFRKNGSGGYEIVAVCSSNDGGDDDDWNYWAGGHKMVEMTRWVRALSETGGSEVRTSC